MVLRSGFADCLFTADDSKGAIGFDWVTVDQGCVSRLISWPRKKLIKQ